MYDSTIHRRAISRRVKQDDFLRFSDHFASRPVDEHVDEAVDIGINGFKTLALNKSLLRGKKVYQLTQFSHVLLLRHIEENIRRLTDVKQDNRDFIINCIKSITSEGISFRIYKFDISAFYESVDPSRILRSLEQDAGFSGQSVRSLMSFFSQLDAQNIVGLPRGLSISAILSEYLLRSFDTQLRGMNHIWFYARFVDDIVLVTDSREYIDEHRASIASLLPDGLQFNRKSRHVTFGPYKKGPGNLIEGQFEFLGYSFRVGHIKRNNQTKMFERDTWLDIADSKIRRIKTRIVKSLVAYNKDGNYPLLLRRIRLLTSNFEMEDRNTGIRRYHGIYYSYSGLDIDRSEGIKELDRFLLNSLVSKHSKNTILPVLSASQRNELLRLGFADGFRQKRFFHFSTKKLAEITKCWKYA